MSNEARRHPVGRATAGATITMMGLAVLASGCALTAPTPEGEPARGPIGCETACQTAYTQCVTACSADAERPASTCEDTCTRVLEECLRSCEAPPPQP